MNKLIKLTKQLLCKITIKLKMQIYKFNYKINIVSLITKIKINWNNIPDKMNIPINNTHI